MCEQNEPWDIEPEDDEVLIFNIIFRKGPPAKSGMYLTVIAPDILSIEKKPKIEITEYFTREDKPELSRWSLHVDGRVIYCAELPELS